MVYTQKSVQHSGDPIRFHSIINNDSICAVRSGRTTVERSPWVSLLVSMCRPRRSFIGPLYHNAIAIYCLPATLHVVSYRLGGWFFYYIRSLHQLGFYNMQN